MLKQGFGKEYNEKIFDYSTKDVNDLFKGYFALDYRVPEKVSISSEWSYFLDKVCKDEEYLNKSESHKKNILNLKEKLNKYIKETEEGGDKKVLEA
jgi:hypothetical protein